MTLVNKTFISHAAIILEKHMAACLQVMWLIAVTDIRFILYLVYELSTESQMTHETHMCSSLRYAANMCRLHMFIIPAVPNEQLSVDQWVP